MKFVRIEMLFLIWSLPVLLIVILYGVRRRNRILDRFAQKKGRQLLAADVHTGRHRIKWALLLAGLLFLIFSMTGPQYGYQWREMKQAGVDIIIALDCSKSMLATDIAPTRLDRAKREVVDLLNMLQGDRVGLVAFAGTAFLQCPLTVDYQAFYLFLDTLTPGFLPVGGTDLAAAVDCAVNGFDFEDTTDKAVILITDGENTGEDPGKAVDLAKEKGIRIFTIGVGKETGVPVPTAEGGLVKDINGKIVVTRLDEKSLKEMALATGGRYVRSVAGDMDLETIYDKEIQQKMADTDIMSGKKQVWEDRFQWFLMVAIVLFAAEMLLPRTSGRKTGLRTGVGLLLCLALLPRQTALAESTYRMAEKGIAAYDRAEFETALKHFVDAQIQSPDAPETYFNIGNAYYKLNDYEAAANNYAQAANSQNKSLRQKALYNLGNARFRNQEIEAAIKAFESALTLNPDDTQARENLEFAKKALAQQQHQPKGGQDKEKDRKEEKASESGQKGPPEKEQKKEDGEQSQQNDSAPSNQNKSSESGHNEQDRQQDTGPPENADGSGQNQGENQKESGKKAGDLEPEQNNPAQTDQTDQAAQAEKREKAGDKSPTESQAARMLNRLKDSPGKALIPAYDARKVEKDW